MREILTQTGVDPQTVTFEITETVMIRNADASIPVLEQLREMGIRLHMDDFGTGYSSLSCLHRFPLTGLKIDQSFIQNAGSTRHQAIVRAIVTLAISLGISLVAEGIETAEQLALLQQLECSQGQGFYFSPPLGATDAVAFLKTGKAPATTLRGRVSGPDTRFTPPSAPHIVHTPATAEVRREIPHCLRLPPRPSCRLGRSARCNNQTRRGPHTAHIR